MVNHENNLPKLAKPALRALAGAGITQLQDLKNWKEEDVIKLHGIGPNAMNSIRLAMEEKGLSFLGQ